MTTLTQEDEEEEGNWAQGYIEGYFRGCLVALQKVSLSLLTHRFGPLDKRMQNQVLDFDTKALFRLCEDCWNFASVDDLAVWLDQEELEVLIWEREQAETDEISYSENDAHCT